MCDRTGCSRIGTHHPVLLLKPLGRTDLPARFVIGVLVCPTCQPTVMVDDLASRDGRPMIDKAFEATHNGFPIDWPAAGIVWERAGKFDEIVKRKDGGGAGGRQH